MIKHNQPNVNFQTVTVHVFTFMLEVFEDVPSRTYVRLGYMMVNHIPSNGWFRKLTLRLRIHFGNAWRTYFRRGRINMNVVPVRVKGRLTSPCTDVFRLVSRCVIYQSCDFPGQELQGRYRT